VNEDKATRYQRLKRLASIAALLWAVALLGATLASGLTVTLRETAEAVSGRLVTISWQPGVTVVVYAALLTLINEIGSLPLSFYSGRVRALP
jgi:phosphate/sulfate permease